MLHSEDALAELRQCLSDLELKYDIESLSSKSVKLKVYVNDTIVNAWFDTQNQYYAFSLFQGGYKSYNTIEEFGTKLNTYLKVHVDFLPKAKAAANQFEAIHGLTTVYDNFSGSTDTGFTATFRVLGKDNYILMVERKNSNYRVLLGELNPEDKSKCRLLSEYVYDFDETGKIGIIPNAYYYADRLAATYDKSQVVKYKRTGVDSYTFQVESTVFTVRVIFSYKTISYQVSEINGRACQLTIKDLPSPFKIEQVAIECKLHFDSLYPIDEEATEEAQKATDVPDVEDIPKVAVAKDVTPKPVVQDVVEKPLVHDVTPQDMAEEIPLFDDTEGGMAGDTEQDLTSPEVKTGESVDETTEVTEQTSTEGVQTTEESIETSEVVNETYNDEVQTCNDETQSEAKTTELENQTLEVLHETTELSEQTSEVSSETGESEGQEDDCFDSSETPGADTQDTISAVEAPNELEAQSDNSTDETSEVTHETQELSEQTAEVITETQESESQTSEVQTPDKDVNPSSEELDEQEGVSTEQTAEQPAETPRTEMESVTEPVEDSSSVELTPAIEGEKPMENPVVSNAPVVPDKIVAVWEQPDDPLVKVVLLDSKPVYLQFRVDAAFYNVSIEVAERLGLPLSIVDEEVQLIRNRGVFLTEDEKKARTFAKDVTQDETMCQRLVWMLFD